LRKKVKRIGLFTSGGDAPGMNACIRAIVLAAAKNGLEVTGIERGYEGMIAGHFCELTPTLVSDLGHRGGTFLKSARSEEFKTVAGRERAAQQLKERKIEGVIAIGGDGTFTGAGIFQQEHQVPFVGVPGTIDNDLFGTDFTIGYDTALNTIVEAVDRIRDTAYAHERLFFVEVMGRDAGLLALRSGIAVGADAILIPETKTYIDQLVHQLEHKWQTKEHSGIIIVAEGDDEGGAYEIAAKVKAQFGKFDTRVTVLGHIQRGGSPSAQDRVLASRLGVGAVEALCAGRSNIMIGTSNQTLCCTPFQQAIKHHQQINPQLLQLMKALTN
jgi:6-phosphofructokinase 1